MSRQRNTFLEIAVILAIVIGCSILIWNYSSFPKGQTDIKTPETATDSAEAPRTHAQNANSEDRKNRIEGKALFKSNCASCHLPKVALTGPALMGVTKRWEDTEMYKGKSGKYWLREWIRDWSEVVKAGHPYAISMANYSPSEMNRFANLSDSDIDKILIYVEASDQAVADAGNPIRY